MIGNFINQDKANSRNKNILTYKHLQSDINKSTPEKLCKISIEFINENHICSCKDLEN